MNSVQLTVYNEHIPVYSPPVMSLFQLVPAAHEAELLRINSSHDLLLVEYTQHCEGGGGGGRRTQRGPQFGDEKKFKEGSSDNVIKVTLIYFQIAFVG